MVSSFGLWKVPGCKAEAVPGTRIDLALPVGSPLASRPGGRCSRLGSGEPSDQAFPLQERGFIPVPLQMGSGENTECLSEGGLSSQPSPGCVAHQSSAVKARSLHSPLEQSPRLKAPERGLGLAAYPSSEMSPSPPQVPRRGPGTAEPALTESDDRLHLQHGVSQAGVPPLDQALLVRHRPVQTLLPVLGDKEL